MTIRASDSPIPAILAATVLVAGMFAFMPVDKATTVHTTIQANTSEPFTATKSLTNIGTTTTALLEFKVNKPFQVNLGSIIVQSTSADGTVIFENIEIKNAAGTVVETFNADDVTVTAKTADLVQPSKVTVTEIDDDFAHANREQLGVVSLPADWSVVINGKGGAAGSDSQVIVGGISTGDATVTIA